MSKRSFAATLVLALSILVPAAMAQEKPAETAKAPRLSFVEPLKDFGTVPKGEVLEWTFEIRNIGNSDLQIFAAKPTCGCTVADFDRVIKPGQTGKLSANVNTVSFTGPIASAVVLETNDPVAPTAQVTISAIVKPYVEAYPAGVIRFNMIQGDVEKQSVILYSEDETPFEIVEITSPQEWIKVEQAKAQGSEVLPNLGRKGQNQYRLDVTVGGDNAKLGPVAERIRVLTTSKYQPEYWLSVSGVMRPAFRVEPSGVNFGEVFPGDASATRSILLRSNHLKTPEAFVVAKAESGIAGVVAEVKPTGAKGEYEVLLSVGKDAKPGEVDGTVLIHTNDRVNPIVTVPVRATVTSNAVTPASGAVSK
jgi:hypothetical protein